MNGQAGDPEKSQCCNSSLAPTSGRIPSCSGKSVFCSIQTFSYQMRSYLHNVEGYLLSSKCTDLKLISSQNTLTETSRRMNKYLSTRAQPSWHRNLTITSLLKMEALTVSGWGLRCWRVPAALASGTPLSWSSLVHNHTLPSPPRACGGLKASPLCLKLGCY